MLINGNINGRRLFPVPGNPPNSLVSPGAGTGNVCVFFLTYIVFQDTAG
jgi:hypothetical protein